VPARQPERDYSHRSRIDKLGVKPGMRVHTSGVEELLPELAERDAQPAQRDVDIAFVQVEDRDALRRLERTWSRVAGRGAMWVVYPRGSAAVRQDEVLAAGRALGLLDVKVVRFSETHTALRFVAPRERR
jgi:hypothetical protein